MTECEILFRGKRKDNGEWVEGYYVCLNGKSHRIYTGYAETDCGHYYPDFYEVIPETVSRYTGLPDKNGKKTFEGDIVKVKHSYHPYEEISTNHCPRRAYGCHWTDFDRLLNYYRNYAVEWKEQDAKFILRNGSDQHRLSRNYISFHGAEVIGNIHDNPELLKGGAK